MSGICNRCPLLLIVLVFILVQLSEAQSNAGLQSYSEGYFSKSSYVILGNTFDLRGHLGFSFRTCGPKGYGTILLQEGNNGDFIKLDLKPFEEGGNLRLTINSQGSVYTTSVGTALNDNIWHYVELKSELGSLQLSVGSETALVANATIKPELLSNERIESLSSGGELIVGKDFTGCLLQGPSITFTKPEFFDAVGVEWGPCPISDTTECAKVAIDPCFSHPCQHSGKCMSIGNSYECSCTLRYTGRNCEVDTGPLCQVSTCLNDGFCQEDPSGNTTSCLCKTGFTGSICQNPVNERLCDNNPCQNDGTCHVSESGDKTECICPEGFAGLNCEVDLNECISSPCRNGGTCKDGVNNYTCFCKNTGYEGRNCDVDVNECEANVCMNGGTCHNYYGGFSCQCPNGFYGPTCENWVEKVCESQPCLNGGLCRNHNTHYTCQCLPGYDGPRCEVELNACENITCPVNSACKSLGVSDFTCECLPGFTGIAPSCTEIDECDMLRPCKNGGSCSDLTNGFICVCPKGYDGERCEIDVNECELNLCRNGAECVDGPGNFTCVCQPGFGGDLCDTNIDECSSSPCLHAITCQDQINGYKCECEPGWGGMNCNEDIDECLERPCLNNGTCINTEASFICQCPFGITGDRCQINEDNCIPGVCLNGGTCIDGLGNYTCLCPDFYMGRHCEIIFDACAASPCLHGGSCITTPPSKSFYCECLPGFEGLNCENNIDDCFGVQCFDGKICFDLVNSYECRCPTGFTGDFCLENINDCEVNPCMNGATCIDGVANYTCTCPPGYSGRNCTEDVDECELFNPCVYGICKNTIGSYECYCRPGFSGIHCNFEFDECLSHPCLNNGTCQNLINGYECFCAPGFTGKDCDINIDECESNPCQNGATCVDGIATYSCICPPGFTGENCNVNIDECESNPCLNGAVCEDGINSYFCNCTDTGFKGTHCETNVDDCDPSPCFHNATCVDLIKDYICECFPGYTGKNCEVDIMECNSFPCQNGATCYERSNATLYDLGIFPGEFSYNTSGGFFCDCLPGYEGDTCEIDINECELTPEAPCKFGTCVDGINSYRCDCFPGYEGEKCENEIDECSRYQPCERGTCVDLIDDYKCECPENYGGKNCSVELLGCIGIKCRNGGVCMPLLINEKSHDFKCDCPHGFHGVFCGNITTMSFDGTSYLSIARSREEGYDLEFRFRTTLPNGLLAVGQGQTYYKLQLSNGQLNLQTSLLNKWDGIFIGHSLNDAKWHNVQLSINSTHLILRVNDHDSVNEVNQVEIVNSAPETSFTTTVLGGTTMHLGTITNGAPNFSGCMEDVVINKFQVIPRDNGQEILSSVNLTVGCPRTDQCVPNPCLNGGQCFDLWSKYECKCTRPYLGNNCQYNYTPATFGHENSTDSSVTVTISPKERLQMQVQTDISLFVRTRESQGLIFYVGTNPMSNLSAPSYIAAELNEGNLMVSVKMAGVDSIYKVENTPLNDGYLHLVQVTRERSSIRAYINETVHINETLAVNVLLNAEVLYLGGLPPLTRKRRQTIAERIASGESLKSNFKGILQDVQVRAGNVTRVVEFFPLEIQNEIEIPEPLGAVQKNDVLEGVVSDDSCRDNPCSNGGVCLVTWNDFRCQCPLGLKGKTCDELEFCSIYQCPGNSTCENLIDGYECLTPATFNGVNATLTYQPILNNISINSITFKLRSRHGGFLLHSQNTASLQPRHLTVIARNDGIHLEWLLGGLRETNKFEGAVLDGEWHQVALKFEDDRIIGSIDGGSASLIGRVPSGFDWTEFFASGSVVVGSAINDNEFLFSSIDALADLRSIEDPFYRGCLDEVRIGNVLLPFFTPDNFVSNVSSSRFDLISGSDNLLTECILCFENECQNGAVCENPEESFVCDCPVGFEGDLCEVNIDECVNNTCMHDSICIDGIGNYTCSCLPGYTGWLCETDIDECESSPCQNGGICIDQIGSYRCNCTEDFVGDNCEKPRIVNCDNLPCVQGTCQNIYDEITGIAFNYTCSCFYAYEGVNCDNHIDFCVDDPCKNGATCELRDVEPGYACKCVPGYEGFNCEIDIDECSPVNPCKNNGLCIDGVNYFECDCTGTGYRGLTCDIDIDECLDQPCENGNCTNYEGSFECECEVDFCGKFCEYRDPCLIQTESCLNGGTCVPICNFTGPSGIANFICACTEGWGGEVCAVEVVAFAHNGVDVLAIVLPIAIILLLIIIASVTTFVMMARKKRATRGTYSPSRQEMFSPRLEMGNVMKLPPEERLI
ncbi:protein crumbs-like [Artemia franciscana]|uniref:Protein crumbs n=1 Tax=Artemia franciscana TaxID=6661 RepID=A0AA88I7X5_ARTSF|nr:hypothetical protein QYM36_003705 [Artemia franciscana]